MSWLGFFERLLAGRTRLGLFLLLAGLLAALGVARVQLDPSIERMHPFGDAVKSDFDHYREAFPSEDSQVFVIVEGPSVYLPAGLAELTRLEEALRDLPGVSRVTGPASARGARGLLIPAQSRDSDERIQAALVQARQDPLSRLLIHAERPLAVVQVTLASGAGAARIRAERAFADAARQVLSRFAAPGLKLTLSGAPAVRAALARMVEEDMGRLLPLVLLVILGLVAFAYRDGWSVLATAATLLGAWLAMVGAMGWMGVPFGVLTSFAPIVVLIVSLTDTVHVLSDLDQRRSAGQTASRALVEAMAGAAGPCLATELVIAGGFLSMGFIGLTAVWEFGLATAMGVLFAWGSNMLVLPWVMTFRPDRAAPRGGPEPRLRWLDDALGWVARQVVQHPRRIVGMTAAVTLLGLLSLTRLDHEYRVFDDLRPRSALAEDLHYAEQALGGLVPLAVVLEPLAPRPGAALAPEALAYQSRVDTALRMLTEQPPVVSLPRMLEPVEQSLLVGLLGRTDETTALALKRVERDQPLDTIVSTDRSAAQVVALLPNVGSERMRELVAAARLIAERDVPAGYRATVTGNLVMTAHVTEMLTQGLLSSFLAAVGVTLVAFLLALRSARLALIGLVPNVLPMGMLFALMPVLGISLKPSTVIIASMALVIADDDTLQYLLRFKRRYLTLKSEGGPEPHRHAALETLAECGRAMFVTAAAVTGGFLLLMLSRFEGIANLGLLTGLTLWVAAIADIFLTPVLLMALRPDLD